MQPIKLSGMLASPQSLAILLTIIHKHRVGIGEAVKTIRAERGEL